GRYGRARLLNRLLLSRIDDLLEAAPEHARAREWHFALWPQALVGHDLLPGLVACRLVGPFDERESDRFAVLGLHGPIEIRDLAVVHVVGERFDHPRRAVLAEDLGHLGRERTIIFAPALNNRNDHSVDVSTARGAFLDDCVEAAHDHALAVKRHV